MSFDWSNGLLDWHIEDDVLLAFVVLAWVHLLARLGYRDISRIDYEETLSWLAFKNNWRTSMVQLH
jgi:hypothetical protein